MKKTAKDKLIELFKDKPVGAVMAWREVAQALGVSSRTVDRLLQNEETLLKHGVVVVRTVSFVKSSSPSGESTAIPKADDGESTAIPKADDGESTAIPKTDDDGESIASSLFEPPETGDDGESTAIPEMDDGEDSDAGPFNLPAGFHFAYLNEDVGFVVVDDQGRINTALTDRLLGAYKTGPSVNSGDF